MLLTTHPLQLVIGTLIFGATLASIMIRPYRISEAVSALLGAVLMLLMGIVQPHEALRALSSQWNVYGFFLGLMAISALADQAGIFDMLAYQAGRWAGGRGLRLYLAVFAAGTGITTLLSNDATALILTPVVYTLVTRLRLPVMPFMFACTFIADTASFLFPVSNPINILVLNPFGSGLGTFLRFLLLPSLFCIGINVLLFIWVYRGDLKVRYDKADLPEVKPPHQAFFHYTVGVLVLIAIAYLVASAVGFPLSIVALGGSGLLFVGAAGNGCLDTKRLGGEISWPLFAFITGMFILVKGVEDLGLTAAFGRGLIAVTGTTSFQAILLTAGGTALGANLINNVPMALVMISVLRTIHTDNQALVYATILGADLGPNLTTVGSLATMLWLVIMRRRGLEISTLEYLKLGITVVPVMILVGSLLIWLKL